MSRAHILAAETLIWQGSPPRRLMWVGPMFGLVVSALALLSAAGRTYTSLLAWLNMWAAFVGPVLVTVLAVTRARMDLATAGGGSWFRAVRGLRPRVARTVLLLAHVLLLNLATVAATLLPGLLLGSRGEFPALLAGSVALVMAGSQAALAALVLRLTARWGAGVGLAVGVLASCGWLLGDPEGGRWWAWPPNWLLRGALPLIGTHPNGVALEPASSAWLIVPWTPAILSVLAAAIVVLIPAWSRGRPSGSPARHSSAGPSANQPLGTVARAAAPTTRTILPAASASPAARCAPEVITAVVRVLGAAAHIVLAYLLAIGAGLIFLRWQDPPQVLQTFSLLVLPAVASLAPVAGWAALAPGWRALVTRPTGVRRPVVAATAVFALANLVVLTMVDALLVLAGVSPASGAATWVAGTATSTMLTALSLWLSARWGTAAALMVSAAGLVLGVLIGGSPLRSNLWLAAPWAWTSLTAPDILAVTVPLALLGTGLALLATVRAGARAATRSGLQLV